MMQLFYYRDEVNFGDAINPWFWSHYIEHPFDRESDELFVGIGTLLNNLLPENFREIHVMGSGAGYGDFVPKKREQWRVHFVRGPLTAKAIGVDESRAICDPAILLNELVPAAGNRKSVCGFMPHFNIDSPRMQQVVEDIGLVYISPKEAREKVIESANQCERLICSAMHGAILAEALRIPWYPVSTSNEILNFKWQDWAQSLQLDFTLHALPSVWPDVAPSLKRRLIAGAKVLVFQNQLKKIQQKGRFILAGDVIFSQRKEQLKETIAAFNRQAKAA